TYTDAEYTASDSLLFGREDTGLPNSYLEELPTDQKLLIPMQPSNRSINLSNSVAIVTYEAWRQLSFQGRI
ncbi:MAG: TrmH family RNA methyltransferase, partial [Chloroflexota bacterium]|nr:TrmH family RNA methyltransferase [Chloroflexota bacterium]